MNEKISLKLSSDEAIMLLGIIDAELEEFKDTKYGKALQGILEEIEKPKVSPFIELTLNEAGALKLYLLNEIRALRFEEDEFIREDLKTFERLLTKLDSSSSGPIKIPKIMEEEIRLRIESKTKKWVKEREEELKRWEREGTKKVCRLLTSDEDKVEECTKIFDRFYRSGDRDEFKLALKKISDLVGLSEDEVAKRIAEASEERSKRKNPCQ